MSAFPTHSAGFPCRGEFTKQSLCVTAMEKKINKKKRGNITIIIPVFPKDSNPHRNCCKPSLIVSSLGRAPGWKASALPRRKKRGALPGPPPSLGVRCHAEKGCPPCRSQGHGELNAEGHLASVLSGSPAWGPVPRAGAGRPEAVAAVTRFLIPPLASASVPRGAAGVDARGLGSRGH